MYQYRLLDYDKRELLVFHWQPGSGFRGPDFPHIHVSAALRAQTNTVTTRELDLDTVHLPTGRVSLEAVVRLLLEEFGIQSQRADWERTLDRGIQTFRRNVRQTPQ